MPTLRTHYVDSFAKVTVVVLENRDRSRITEVFSDRVLLHFLKRRTRFIFLFFLCI